MLLLPGHRSLGTFALEELGETRVVQLPAGGGRRGKRRLVISTTADGPTRVLRVVDVTSHPQGASGPGGAPPAADEGAAAAARRAPTTGQALVRQLRAALPRGLATAWVPGGEEPRSGGGGGEPLLEVPRAAAGGGGAAAADLQQTRRARRGGGGAAAAAPAWPLDCRAELRGFCLSLVSDNEELLFAAARGLSGRLTLEAVRVRGALAVDSVRVENTLHGAVYPLLLASPVKPSVFGVTYEGGSGDAATPLNAADGGNTEPAGSGGAGGGGGGSGAPPALGVLCTLWRDRPGGVACFERLGVHAAPLAVSLEGLHLKSLLEFAAAMEAAAARHGLAAAGSGRGGSAGAPPAPGGHPMPRGQPLKLYFEELFVSPLQLCITFAPGSWFEQPAAAAPAPGDGPGAAAAGGATGGAGEEEGGGVAAAAVAAPALAAPPVWAQIAAALAHTEGAWLTLGALHERHPLLGVDALAEVRPLRGAVGIAG
jgi:hypothetical protein